MSKVNLQECSVDEVRGVWDKAGKLLGVLSMAGDVVSMGAMSSSATSFQDAVASWYPCDLANTVIGSPPRDAAGGVHGVLGAGLTAAVCNATVGRMTTAAAVNGYVQFPIRVDMAKESFDISFDVIGSAPGAHTYFAGSADFSSAETGLLLRAETTGKMRVFMANGAVIPAALGVGVTAATVFDGASHKVSIKWDFISQLLLVYVDGAVQLSLHRPAEDPGVWSRDWMFGSNKAGITCLAVQIGHFNIVRKAGACLPHTATAMAVAYAAAPGDLRALFPLKSLALGVGVQGQSNQLGQGVTAGVNIKDGAPLMDPIKRSGQVGKRSAFIKAAEVLGTGGYVMHPYNNAKGGSSLLHSWVGDVSDYVLNGWAKKGTFKAFGGTIYKADMSDQNGIIQMTKAPGPGVVDGALTWSVFGVDDGYRGVANENSVYFDPCGNHAASNESIRLFKSLAPKAPYIHCIGGGETDASMGVTRDKYAAALLVSARVARRAGADAVQLGFTFGTVAPFTAIYDSTLEPALSDALALLAGESWARAGFNFRKIVGAVLPTAPASGPGFQDNGVADRGIHGLDAAYDAAGLGWGAELLKIAREIEAA